MATFSVIHFCSSSIAIQASSLPWWKYPYQTLLYGRLSLVGVFLSWKTRYLNCYTTAAEICYRKDSYYKRYACYRFVMTTSLLQEHIFRNKWT